MDEIYPEDVTPECFYRGARIVLKKSPFTLREPQGERRSMKGAVAAVLIEMIRNFPFVLTLEAL